MIYHRPSKKWLSPREFAKHASIIPMRDYDAALLAKHDCVWVEDDPQPAAPDAHTSEIGEPKERDGKWVREYTIKRRPAAEAAAKMRRKRNRLLQQSDGVVCLAYEMRRSVPQAWKDYRQALRDVPSQAGFPFSIDWPAKP